MIRSIAHDGSLRRLRGLEDVAVAQQIRRAVAQQCREVFDLSHDGQRGRLVGQPRVQRHDLLVVLVLVLRVHNFSFGCHFKFRSRDSPGLRIRELMTPDPRF